jgi:hypothetical protein
MQPAKSSRRYGLHNFKGQQKLHLENTFTMVEKNQRKSRLFWPNKLTKNLSPSHKDFSFDAIRYSSLKSINLENYVFHKINILSKNVSKTIYSCVSQVEECDSPSPANQHVGSQLCDMVMSGSRLSMVDGARFDKVEVDCEIVAFQPATKRKPSKESYYLTRYDPEELLNDTSFDPCELATVSSARSDERRSAERQYLRRAPSPPSQTLYTYTWLESESDESVIEQVKLLTFL